MPNQLHYMKKLIFKIVCAVLLPFCAMAQTPAEVFNYQKDSLPAERVYIHFDKQAYMAGNVIWFKAYLISRFAPSAISTDFYIDLLNENDSIVASKKFPIINGTAIGNFDLPANSQQGLYLVRGYTKWLLNFDPSFVFKKSIPVFNPSIHSSSAGVIKNKAAYHFEMFPEGGQ